MRLLSLLKSLPDSNHMQEEVRGLLAEASLHFLHVSTYSTLHSDTSTKTRELLIAGSSLKRDFQLGAKDEVDRLSDEWEKRIILGVMNLFQAVEIISPTSVCEAIQEIISKYCGLYLKIIDFKDSYNPEDYFYLYNTIRDYRDYAVPLISSTRTSLASWIRDKGVVQASSLESLSLIKNIGVDLSSDPGVYGACLLITVKRPDLAHIDDYTNRVLDLLDKADDAARIARMSGSLSDYLNAVLIAHLLYSASTTSLNWIIESSCGSLITEPITDMIGKAIMSNSVFDSQSIKKMLLDGALRNPVYHEKLKSVWQEVIDDVFQHNHRNQMESSQVCELASELQQSACKHFPDYFDDSAVSRTTSIVQSNWYFNRMGYCR